MDSAGSLSKAEKSCVPRLPPPAAMTRNVSGYAKAVVNEVTAKNRGQAVSGGYGVKLVRGPFVELPPHAGHVREVSRLVDLCDRIRQAAPGVRLAADLFSGAGGLSLGLRDAGVEVVFAVDHDTEAIRTHAHHFPGASMNWDLSGADVIERVAGTMRDAGITILVGGPPCQPFSKAGRSGIRHRVRHGQRDPHDQRRDLWRSFLEVVRLAAPEAVIMENVPDMALDNEMFILRSIVEELEGLGYGVEERVIDTWRYGVPQFRQRLIIVALAGGAAFEWPLEAKERVSVWNAIGDLPEVQAGWRPADGAYGWASYDAPVTEFQRLMRTGVSESDKQRLYDHITRPVRDDDARAFELMDTSTRYSDLPAEMKRYRDDIFNDKYKRLDENDLSRTITAHIAKDGYWYIHPRQGRTLTVREAARLQTFPDWYRFSGPPSAAFRQIGNAVPPMVASQVARAVTTALGAPKPRAYSTQQIAGALSGWFARRDQLQIPWLRASTRWQVIMAAVLLDRATNEQVRRIWPILRMWPKPADATANAELLHRVGEMTGRSAKVAAVLELAVLLAADPDLLNDDRTAAAVSKISRPVADLAVLAVPTGGEDEGEEPVGWGLGVLRVAARFAGEPVDRRNRRTDGRLAVARMVGGGATSRAAQLGLIELAASLCRPVDPVCIECPLNNCCASAHLPATLLDTDAGEARSAQLA